jgi:hypothetical protein
MNGGGPTNCAQGKCARPCIKIALAVSKQYRGSGDSMRRAIYNFGIPHDRLNTILRIFGAALRYRFLLHYFLISILAIATTGQARATDWSSSEQELARKIVAATGPGVVALTFQNMSSLGHRDNEIVENGLRSALQGLGLRFASADQSAATVKITLSENVTSYVWVAQIRQSAGEAAVAMISLARPEGSSAVRESVPLTLEKISLWTQSNPILDVAVLEENPAPTHIAVLDGEKVALYRQQNGKWQQAQILRIAHTRPWPRDLRGRLIFGRDHLIDVYLPGVFCSSTASQVTLSCRESDDPWPLVPVVLTTGKSSVLPNAGANNANALPQTKAFFASTRNFFTGVVTPGVGKLTAVPKFYSAAPLPREKYTLWIFSATDGQIHLIDGVSDQIATGGWGSDLAGLRTECGAGWQVLAGTSGEEGDSLRAYEFPDRDPVAVTSALDFPGPITALWTEAKGDTAVAVIKNRETGSYEAFRLALACDQ